jgi:hypothetical protein
MLDTTCNLENFEFVDFGIYYGVGLLLVLQILPLLNQIPKRKILVAQGRVKFYNPLYVDGIDHKT